MAAIPCAGRKPGRSYKSLPSGRQSDTPQCRAVCQRASPCLPSISAAIFRAAFLGSVGSRPGSSGMASTNATARQRVDEHQAPWR